MMRSLPVSVRWGCCCKVPWTEGLINNSNVFISHYSEGCKSKFKASADSVSGEDPSLVHGRLLLTVSSLGSSLGPFNKGTDPVYEDPTVFASAPPKGPASEHHHTRVRFPAVNLGVTETFNPQHSPLSSNSKIQLS